MTQGLPVENRTRLNAEALRELTASVAGFETLEDLIRWGREQQPAVAIESVVTQDEFTHDVLVPIGSELLVFDTS